MVIPIYDSGIFRLCFGNFEIFKISRSKCFSPKNGSPVVKVSSPWKITHHPNSYFTRKRLFARSEWPRIYFFSRTISRTHFHRTFLSEPKNFLSQKSSSERKNSLLEKKMNDQIKSVSGVNRKFLKLSRLDYPCPGRICSWSDSVTEFSYFFRLVWSVDPWSVIEKQSLIIAKQKKLIFRLHEELEKRNLKTEEVLLVLQGVTMGLKATRNDSTCFSRVQQTELRPPDGPFRPGLLV